MVHGTLLSKPVKYWTFKCTSTVPPTTLYKKFWYSRGTLLLSITKGVGANVPCTTISKTMELLKYCRENNIYLKLPGMAEHGQTNEATLRQIKEEWDISPMEEYFNTCSTLPGPLSLDQCTTVFNPSLFISSHLATIKAHNGNPVYRPYFDRLANFYQILGSMNLNLIQK